MAKNPKLLRLHWADQITGEPNRTADFYSELLGFAQSDVDEGNGYTSYSMTDADGNDVFGIVEEAVFKHWHPGWVLYFEVDDFEASCDQVEALGGTIMHRGQTQCLFKDPAGTPSVLVRATEA